MSGAERRARVLHHFGLNTIATSTNSNVTTAHTLKINAVQSPQKSQDGRPEAR